MQQSRCFIHYFIVLFLRLPGIIWATPYILDVKNGLISKKVMDVGNFIDPPRWKVIRPQTGSKDKGDNAHFVSWYRGSFLYYRLVIESVWKLLRLCSCSCYTSLWTKYLFTGLEPMTSLPNVQITMSYREIFKTYNITKLYIIKITLYLPYYEVLD